MTSEQFESDVAELTRALDLIQNQLNVARNGLRWLNGQTKTEISQEVFRNALTRVQNLAYLTNEDHALLFPKA